MLMMFMFLMPVLRSVRGFSTIPIRTATKLSASTCGTPPPPIASTPAPSGALNIYTLSTEDLTSILKSWSQPGFRAKQIREWIYDKGVVDFAKMENLPSDLRTKLSEAFVFGSLQIASEQVSKDGTMKRAYQLHDKQLIESVLMPYEDGRRTACISSQAGCAMGCVFCATGQMGFSRQLTSTEIFEQTQRFSAELRAKDERLSNVVMMGMGEPLANYDNILTAIRRMHDELGIGYRHITISTVGLAPRIRKLADEVSQSYAGLCTPVMFVVVEPPSGPGCVPPSSH